MARERIHDFITRLVAENAGHTDWPSVTRERLADQIRFHRQYKRPGRRGKDSVAWHFPFPLAWGLKRTPGNSFSDSA
jgi:hypothetical protein